ncbi:MAG TPA: trigger factor [Solirubrobacterales bacterium]|jgi:trigger factor|nr:trigger factor [Solirubrobacterales bacterium]
METNVTELPDSRARVEVSVDPGEVDTRLKETAQRLGGEMKVPGFRKGKVPPEMVLQRLGRQTVLTETLEGGALGDWYERAMLDSGVSAVGDPKLDLTELPDEGQPLRFSIEVAVRPSAELGEYKGLEVGRADMEVPADAVNQELDRLRDGFAKLNPVDRRAAEGDVALIDYEGTIDGEPFEGGAAKDYLLELGAGRVLPEFEQAVEGAAGGEEKEATVNFPDDYQGEDVAGKTAQFKINVREVREKELPELDDDFAAEASEFETLDELRSEISDRIREYLESQTAERFRETALDAAVANAKVEIPDEVVKARANEMWERVERRLRQQGMDPNTYLQMQGKTRDEIVDEARPDASRALKREAVLEAVADAEGIEITEEDMLDALQVPPGHEDHGHPEPADALAELRKSGREELLKQDLRMRRALDVISESATPIPLEQAEAREQIWTPEKEREEKGALWTPGSD